MTLHRTYIGIGLAAVVLTPFIFGNEIVGFSMHISNGDAEVRGGTHPFFLAASIVGLFLFAALMHSDFDPTFQRVPRMRRRLAAFGLDFLFCVFCLGAIVGLIMVGTEALRTGSFTWEFQRTEVAWTDNAVGLPLILVGLVLLFFYFTYSLTRGRPTIGCYLTGIALTLNDRLVRLTLSQAVVRTFYEFWGLCSWPITLYRGIDRQGRTWYDREIGGTVLCFRGEARFVGVRRRSTF